MIKNENFNEILYEALQEQKNQTNADRIRSMTDEELAEFFTDLEYDGRYIFICPSRPKPKGHCNRSDCRECFLRWLKQEYKGGKP